MTKERNNQNLTHWFTLIEMVIVLIIMWIMLMFTTYLSGSQIQKIKDKTVKESILSEMLSRYSRNLWSSSFGWSMYSTMDVTMEKGWSKIDFVYNKIIDGEPLENVFNDNFEIKYLGVNYEEWKDPTNIDEKISLKYSPYKISCKIWDEDESYKNLLIITRVNASKDYCFEIKQKNCRLTEISEETCNDLIWQVWIND